MPWVTITSKQLAKKLGINYDEHLQKHQLIEKIVATRKEQGLSQAQLANMLGVSQSRIAKIESRLGTAKVSYDLILKILTALGFKYSIVTKKNGSTSKKAA